MQNKPRIAVTLGDPAGIGPELVAKLCYDQDILDSLTPIIVGHKDILRQGAAVWGLPLPEVEVVAAGEKADIIQGCLSPQGGRLAGLWVETAAKMCLGGQAHGMTTAPLSKESLQAGGYPDTGHTTLLGRLLGVPRPVMMLAGDKLKVSLVTVHEALSQALTHITQEKIVHVAGLTAQALRDYWRCQEPRLAVAALNPHAGEHGLFGREEEDVISPAIQTLEQMGFMVSGPHPPDTVFWQAHNGLYDAVVCLYHDQGLIPFKLLHFHDGVNLTLGLPIIRTSPDHGTALDLAGKGQARPDSMKAALLLAARMAAAKA